MALGLTPGIARADDVDDFFFARDAYQHLDFTTAIEHLRPLMGPTSTLDPRLAGLARKLYAASLYGLDRTDVARAAVADLLREDPDARVDDVQFDAGFVRLFEGVRELLANELVGIRSRRERDRIAAEAARAHRRELALSLMSTDRRGDRVSPGEMFVPFGVGQFANRQTGLGVFFLATEAVLLATSAATWLAIDQLRPASGVIYGSLTSTAPDNQYLTLRALEVTNYVSVGLFAAVAVAGIVQALVAYTPDGPTVLRPRPLPPELRGIELSVAPHSAALRLAFDGP